MLSVWRLTIIGMPQQTNFTTNILKVFLFLVVGHFLMEIHVHPTVMHILHLSCSWPFGIQSNDKLCYSLKMAEFWVNF